MNKKILLLSCIPLLLTGMALPFLPAKVPMHYDLVGRIDRFGSKWELLVLPIAILMISLVWDRYIRYSLNRSQNHRYDNVRKEALINAKNAKIAMIAMSVLFGLMQLYFLALSLMYGDIENLGRTVDINRMITGMTGFFIAGIGYFSVHERRNRILTAAGIVIALQGLIIGGVSALVIMVIILLIAGVLGFIDQTKKS